MTDLRRIAQLVQDLQTLQVIKEDDVIDFRMVNSRSISLTIQLKSITTENGSHGLDYILRTKTIKRAIKNEFNDKAFKFDDSEDVYCRFFLER